MKRQLLIIGVAACAALTACNGDDDNVSIPTGGGQSPGEPSSRTAMALTQYVDPLIGTAVPEESGYAGNVSPGAQMPFGMVSFGPNTPRQNFNGSGGYLSDTSSTSGRIDFFSTKHLSGVGCPGEGVVAMLPNDVAEPIASDSGQPSTVGYDYTNEAAHPGYYKVRLANGIETELTATTRSGSARITYTDKDKGFLAIDTKLNGNSDQVRGGSPTISSDNVSLAIGKDGRSLSGQAVAPAFCTPYGTVWNSPVYFFARFDTALRRQTDQPKINTVVEGSTIMQFDLTTNDKVVDVDIGVSAVSVANARKNLQAENASASFDTVRKQASNAWNKRLNTIQIDEAAHPATLKDTQKEDLTKFYTALYHVFSAPNVYSDVNGDFRSMRQPKDANGMYRHKVDETGSIPDRKTANVADYDYQRSDGAKAEYDTHYTSLSLWDTYRSQTALIALLAPSDTSAMMQSLVVDGMQCGALPHRVDASDDSTPNGGDNALNVIASAYQFGARDFDLVSAARLVRQSAFDPDSACNDRASDPHLASYLRAHYYPDIGQPSSHQIERVIDDRSAGAFLQAVPEAVRNDPSVSTDQGDIDRLFERASWWTNIFDAKHKRIAARGAPPPGSEAGTLGPIIEGGFHESTEPNYFWSFPQSWTPLIDAIGGKSAALARLNRLFSIDDGLTMTPTAAELNGGQTSAGYYIGNEPAFQAPWAYNWAGKPSAAQYIIPIIMRETFSTARDGLPGNDDMGALSSWYVWSTLGLYPVVPSAAGLAISTPQFKGITVWLADGKKLRIETDQSAEDDDTPFIKTLTVNGKTYSGSWLPLDRIADGGSLRYKLSPTATDWAAADNLTPPSGPDADYDRMTAADPSAAAAIGRD